MFSVFTELSRAVRGVQAFPEANAYREGCERNVLTMQKYFRQNTFTVLNNHLLVRLLGSLSIPFGGDVRKYYDQVYDFAYDLAAAMNITSPNRTGQQSEEPYLYGTGCTEFPVALHERRWDLPEMTEANGYGVYECPPLRILRHPRSDWSFDPPDGKAAGTETGIVVWTIDIPLLACQWRAFRLDQYAQPSGDQMGEQHFIMKYVLPSLIPDHLNIATANALMKTYRNQPLGENKRRVIVGLPNFDLRLDRLMRMVADWIPTRKLSYSEMTASFPLALPKENWRSLFLMPNTLYTRQINWVLFLARLPYVAFLMEVDRKSGAEINGTVNNLALRELRFARNDSVFRQHLLGSAYNEMSSQISALVD